MSTFELYLKLGLEHIADFSGYDHILFILVLVAIYTIKEWSKILILITAFTIGHTGTLILATFDIIQIQTNWIEFLIPITILITAIANLFQTKANFSHRQHKLKYLLALFFGLIHGLGFSNFLRSLLSAEDHLAGPLFSFNLGIELGQLIIVSVIIALGFIMISLLKVKKREWNLVLSGAGLGISLILIFERIPF